MADLSDVDFEAANDRGEAVTKSVPLALSAHYDRDAGRMVLTLNNGAIFTFLPTMVQGLESATAEELAHVEVSGGGFGLHWEALDVDFTVPGLLAGRFGTARYMRERFGTQWDAAAAE